MGRIIKVTEQQLKEALGDAFSYLDFDSDVKPFDGNTNISVTGKLSDTEDGAPVTTDDIGTMLSPQNYISQRTGARMYNRPATFLREDDKNNDGVDDFFNHDELDVLSNGDDSDDITRVPGSVLNKLDLLLKAMETMSPKQKAMVVNKLIESIDWSAVMGPWRKELSLKIMGNPHKVNQVK